jgi:hypothetical protein
LTKDKTSNFFFIVLIRINWAAQRPLSTAKAPGAGRGRARTGSKCFACRGERGQARTALPSG